MPDELHAVSCCLPHWAHNIGYEEGDPQVVDKLQAAYPRFCLHPLVQQLCDRFLNQPGRFGLPFVSVSAAKRAVQYVNHAASTEAEVTSINGQMVCGVTVDSAHSCALKQYWQHAGENASSRVAQQILNGVTAECSATPERSLVRERVAQFQHTSPDNVFLFPSGMAAIACTIRAIQKLAAGPIVQFGFPYVDTLKILQRFPGGTHQFYPLGSDADLQQLETLCTAQPPAAVICEVPTNPLLTMPDLLKLRKLADRYGFLLIADDTLAACGNLNLLPHVDALVTSLTKYFSGYGNVLAGSVTLNTDGSEFRNMKTAIAEDFEETLADIDATVLAQNSTDLAQRLTTINHNAKQLAKFFRQHPKVESVCYPGPNNSNYESLRTASGGYGGLMSVVLHNPEHATPAMFDSLEICKGPNLGTNFTLCCPYTLLAHYTELDFAERCGVSRWLLRISVGTEPYGVLEARFAAALENA